MDIKHTDYIMCAKAQRSIELELSAVSWPDSSCLTHSLLHLFLFRPLDFSATAPTMSPPSVTLTLSPHSPARSRSVSQPIPEDAALDTLSPPRLSSSRAAALRSLSSNSVSRGSLPFLQNHTHSNSPSPQFRASKGRARSSSLVTVTEVGGDDPDNVVDRLGAGNNENAAWVNAPGQSFASEKESCCATSSLYFASRCLADTSCAHLLWQVVDRRDTGYDTRCQLDNRQSQLYHRRSPSLWTRYDSVCLQNISSPSSCSITSPDFHLNLP